MAAYATESSSAAVKSEAQGGNKPTDEEENGGTLLTCIKQHHQAHILSCNIYHNICFSDDKAAQSLLNKLIRNNLVNTTNQVEVLQKDPNSPLYSVKSFEELRL